MKNIILFLVLLGIMTGNTFSANPSVIWGGAGDALVLPPNGFTLESGTKIYDLSVDPSVSAVNAPIGSYGTYLGKLYVKQDAGSTTNWIPLQQELTVPLPIAEGGTNSSTALANDKIIYSQGGAVVESSIGLDSSANITDVASIEVTGDVKVFEGTSQELNVGREILQQGSTGVTSPNGLEINIGDNTKYDILATTGQIIDRELDTYVNITYAGSTGNTPATANGVTYVFLDNASSIATQTTPPTPSDRREKLYLGRVVTIGGTVVQVLDEPVVVENIASSFYDLAKALRLFNISGNIFTANGANLKLNKSAGKLFSAGSNYVLDRNTPHDVSLSSCTACTFAYFTQVSGSTGANVTDLDFTQYDNAGTLTAIGGASKQSTIQHVYLFPSGNIRVQYGQTIYSDLATAISAVGKETFIANPNTFENGILIANIVARKDATDLTDTSKVVILYPSRFGEGAVGAAGQSVSSLQNAYDNSTEGEIVLSAENSGFKILDNATSIELPLFQVLSNDELTNYFTVDLLNINTAVDFVMSGTGYFKLPVGTTLERPTASTGMTRFNSDEDCLEIYNATEWVCVSTGGDGSSGINFIIDGSFEKEELSFDGANLFGAETYPTYTADDALASEFNEKYYNVDLNFPFTANFEMGKSIARTGLQGKSGLFSVWIKSDRSDIDLCLSVDDSDFSEDCRPEYLVALKGDGEWHKYEFRFLYGTTSVEFRFYNPLIIGLADISVDTVYIGTIPDGINTLYGHFSSTVDERKYTPTTQGFGTISSDEVYYSQVGQNLFLRGRFVVGTPTATQGRIYLPTGLTISSNVTSLTSFGTLGRNTAAADSYRLLGVAGNNYLTISYNATLTQRNPSEMYSAGDIVHLFSVGIPIEGWSSGKDGVLQNEVLTAQTSNKFSLNIPYNVNPTKDTFDIIDTCSEQDSGTKVVRCTYNTGIFTVIPTITSVIPYSGGSTGHSPQCTVNASTLTYFEYNCKNSTTAATYSVGVEIEKATEDYNKNVIKGATFEGINSTDLCQVEAFGNDGEVITSDTEDIPWKTIAKDNCGAWTNAGNTGSNTADGYTAPKNSRILVTMNYIETVTSAITLNVYKDNVFLHRCGNAEGSATKNLACQIDVVAGSLYTFRPNGTRTLLSSVDHRIQITEMPDYEAIVQNLNDATGLVAYLKDIKPNNTTGGGCTAGSYAKHDLTTIEGNSSLVTLASSEFTLKAGTYELNGYSTMSSANRHRAKIRNITTGTDAILGDSAYTTSSTNVHTKSFFDGIIVVPSDQTFQLQYRCETTDASDGLGVASNFGEPELFALVKIRKIGN